jgi:predicted metal-dependent enzyme (double-stranded beta helix superfamily)
MCGTDHAHDHEHGQFGFLVDTPEIRALIGETERLMSDTADPAIRVEALKPAFAKLLSSDHWLPEQLAQPMRRAGWATDRSVRAVPRGRRIAVPVLTRRPARGVDPGARSFGVGLVGVYRGEQDETVYRRLDDGSNPAQAELEIAKRQALRPGDLYALIPPTDDIHYVKTISQSASISIHLLANDTACVWRHKYDPASGVVTPFRSGYANAPCPSEAHA